MAEHVPVPADRTAPGHYQARLTAVLSRHPVRGPAPTLAWRAAHARHAVSRQPAPSRSRQLALPLDSR